MSNTDPQDQLLQTAADECEAILAKYNLVGLVIVSTAEQTKYSVKLDAPWTCSRVEDGRLRMEASPATHPDPADRQKAVTDTVSAISGLNTVTEAMQANFTEALLMISRQFSIHGRNTLTPNGR